MSREDMEVLVSQPLPSAGNLAWVWLSARSSEPLQGVVRLLNGSELVQELACEALEGVYLGRSFAALCRPGMQLQVLVPKRAASSSSSSPPSSSSGVAFCETRFGFALAETSRAAGDVVEQRYQPAVAEEAKAADSSNPRERHLLVALKPREQRLTFLTVAYRCRSSAQTAGVSATLYLEISSPGAASPQLEPVCTVLARQTAEGVFEVAPSVLGAVAPQSRIAIVRHGSTMQVLDLHVEVGYLPHHHRIAFQSMLQDPTFADVTLISEEGSRFPAHRAILVARSPVFESMFCGSMREASEREVFLDDIHGSVLANLLHFIYTGELEEDKLAGCVDALALAANRLQIEDLVSACCNFMAAGLDEDNVLSIFQLADACNFAELRGAAKRFIGKHLSSLRQQGEFDLLPESVREELERTANEQNA